VSVGQLVAAIAAGTFLWCLASMARTPRMRLNVADDMFELRLGLLDALFSLRRSVTVAIKDVTAVLVQPHVTAPPSIRFPGTSLPGLIHAGAYRIGSEEEFWNVRRAHVFLAVHLAHGAPYRKLVLEVDDPRGVAADLRARLQLA
jgi:hypothetical protein